MHLQISKPFLFALILVLNMPLNSYSADVENGRRIYMEGIMPSGTMLKSMRSGNEFSGKQAACVSCHRPSGMGSVEGDIAVPPITGNYLYRTGDFLLTAMDPRSGKRFNQAHAPYNDDKLSDAIQHGVNVDGQQMNVLMPRYELKGDNMRDLLAYLKQLSKNYSTGVSKNEVHFATVITPDADPEQRRMLLNILNKGIMQKNGSTVLGDKRTGRRHMVSAAELVLGTERNWQLHVWDLKGQPDTWQAQLDNFYLKEPVFALLSGLSGSTWQPVHNFCEQKHVPCWFPSVTVPGESREGFYSIYYQRGVKLEAAVLAKYLGDASVKSPRRVVQIYHDDAVGREASSALASETKNTGIAVENRPLEQIEPQALGNLLNNLDEHDAVMLWLDKYDLPMLENIMVPSAPVFFSGRMIGDNAPLNQTWKQAVKVIYPYELPNRRQVNLNYFHRWMQFNHIQIEDEPLQAEAYFALEFLSETMSEMLDNIYSDYLIERAETMLSRSQSGNSEIRDRARQVLRWSTRTPRGNPQQAAKIEASIAGQEKSIPGSNYAEAPSKSTTIYPRMSLGVSQRFASKGAYIVRFDDTLRNKITPISPWIVP